ncbi:MAG: DUF4198 domain-containing protein [Paracoccaceae bacterium]
MRLTSTLLTGPIFAALTLCSTTIAFGHEFWISPQKYQLAEGEPIIAALRVGQDFKGASYAYLPPEFERFDLVQGDRLRAVEGRIGDRPALNMAAPNDGLWIVVHETRDYILRYSEAEKFVKFTTHKDFPEVVARHAERGFAPAGFAEAYRRFGKSLVAVGAGAGQDRDVGLRTEIVARANPYTDDLSGGLPVDVYFEGAPRVDVQVEVFARYGPEDVRISTVRTDENGRAIIPVEPGVEYLLDAVVMLPLEAKDAAQDPVWNSLWASLTFKTPQP